MNIGDVIYHPVIDSGVGLAIEQVSITKLIGPSKNPYGYSHIIWTHGDCVFLHEQEAKRQGAPRIFLKKNCYSSIEECIEYLESRRMEFIESLKRKRDDIAGEIIEFKKMLIELEAESIEINRSTNKSLNMLNKLDIRANLEKRGLI